jgi:hypothetical protein
MGVVMLARDTKLGRRVAIKSLPDLFSRDPVRRSREAWRRRPDDEAANLYAASRMPGPAAERLRRVRDATGLTG